ncbi:hypothetical protein GCM10007380_04840 [Gottfriedia solisilvae]|uniref:Uncharacterized protein n=1 Tax=Gottfriedia solisilvae TaxID=1516104 RepID=A0A8J3AES4_9BACI|nr:hypothetical protein GCM10007380_04840 [Gottfriedia solisilvae]
MIKTFNKLIHSYSGEDLSSKGFSLSLKTVDGSMYYEKRMNGF